MPTTTLGPGALLRAARIDNGMTQAELALKLQVTPGFINQIELGRRTPSLESVDKIALAIGCDPHSIDNRLSPLRLRK